MQIVVKFNLMMVHVLTTIFNLFNEVQCKVIYALLFIQEKLGELARKAGWPGQAMGVMSSFGSTKFTYYRNQIRSNVRANTSWFYVICHSSSVKIH